MGFVLGRVIRLELDGVPLGVEEPESVVPPWDDEATQRDWPIEATEEEPDARD